MTQLLKKKKNLKPRRMCGGANIKFFIPEDPGKDFTPWVCALYRVNKRVLTRKIGHSHVTLRDITP
jgi:hypothetical protein